MALADGGNARPRTPGHRHAEDLLTAEAHAALNAVGPRSCSRLRIAGNTGSGRSTVLNEWVAGYRERYPQAFTFVHATDGPADHRDPRFFTWRLLNAIKTWCELPDPVPLDAESRREALPNWLGRAAARGNALLVIDGMEGFESDELNVQQNLLPDHQPPGLSVVVADAGYGRPAGEGWQTLRLCTLSRVGIMAIVAMRMPHSDESIRSAIAEAPGSANPLFLHTLLNILATRPQRIGQLARWLECQHPQTLFDRLLEALEAESKEDGTGTEPMTQALSLLWAARNTLDAEQIRVRLNPPAEGWRRLADMLAPFATHNDGGWRLAPTALREAVATRYLSNPAQREAAHLALARAPGVHPDDGSIDMDAAWHLAQAGRSDLLRNHLSRPQLFSKPMAAAERFELLRLWQSAGSTEDITAACRSALAALDPAPPAGAQHARAIIDIADCLQQAGTDAASLGDFYVRAQTMVAADPAATDHDRGTVQLAHGAHHGARGDLEQAESLLRAARDALGTAATHEFARLHEMRGDLPAAESMYREILSRRERELGRDHPGLLPHLANLVAVQRAAHRFDDAEPLARRALDIAERQLGDEHPATPASADRLAGLRYAVHDYEQAETLYRRALTLSETIFGPRHPATAAALHNLGTVVDARERFREAESLHRRALEIRETVLGAEHEDTVTSVHNLASALDSMGRYDEAESLYRRAIASWESLVGADHPATATSVNNLADLLRERGDFTEAERLYRRNIETWRHLMGEDHPNTLLTLIELAGLYADSGRREQAEPLLWHGVEVSEQVMGPTGLVHINAVCKLAALLRDDGRRDAARALLEKTCAAADDTLDAISPRIQKVRRQLEALDRDDV